MKILTIALPDPINRLLEAEAKNQNIDVITLCSGLVVEHFLTKARSGRSPVAEDPTTPVPRRKESSNMFDVKAKFPGYPERSIELAQQFTDEALKLPGVTARPTERGVGLVPNFAWIEYLHKRYPGAIGLSFYGSQASLPSADLLMPGRTSSYSRAIAHTQEELKRLLDVMRKSYWLKTGRKQ